MFSSKYLRALASVVLLASVPVFGQISATTGAVQGLVTDPSHASIANARIVLTNTDTNQTSNVQSKSDGGFVFPLVSPGNYRLQVEMQGFQKLTVASIKVDVTRVSTVNAELQIGQVAIQETVIDQLVTVDTHTATTGDVISGTQIREIPLPTRNFLDLTALQAGTSARIQSAATVGRGAPILNVAGARSTLNNFVLDGVDANNFGSGSFSSVPVPNPDAVSEFRVSTSLYDASAGRGAGGNINVVLRSGTSHYHGGLFEFFRSNNMNANDFFSNAAGKPVPVLLQNQFGGQVGGPIPKLKDTFFFFSYQGTRQKNGVSSLISGAQPVLPTVRSAANLASAFGIPIANIDPVAVNILNAKGQYGGLLYPSGSCTGAANCTGVGGTGLLVASLPTIYNENQYAGTIDRNLFRNNHLGVQVFYADITQFAPTGGGVTIGQGLNSPATNNHVALTDTETFSANLINEFRTGFTNIKSTGIGTENVNVSDIGMQKWDSSLYPGIPLLSITGLLSFGGIGVNSYSKGGTTTITTADTLSWTAGKHTIRFGVENRRYGWNYDNEYGTRGALSFPNFNSFLTGTPNRLQVVVGNFARNYRAQDLSGFVQDDFHLSRRLTLNLGLRYDYFGFPTDLNHRVGSFDPSQITAACVAGGGGNCVQAGFIIPASVPGIGTPGASETAISIKSNTNFSPRIGVAYDVFGNGKLAVRGGYGIYYVRTSGQTVLQPISSPPWVEQYLSSGTAIVGSKVLANPWPAGLPLPNQFPILPTIGQFNGKFTAAGAPIFVNPDGTPAVSQSLYGFTKGVTTPYVHQYNFTLQYQLPQGWMVEAGYLGSHGVKLLVEPSLNQALLVNSSNPMTYSNSFIGGAGYTVTQNSNANAPIRVPVPGFSPAGLNLVTNQGASYYNALILGVSHSFARGFQFKMDYTHSRSTDNDSGPASSDLDSFQSNQLVPGSNWGVSDFNQRNRLVLTGVWQVPGPKTGLLGQIAGGWGLSGVWTFQSGLPFTITSTTGGGLAGLTGSVTVRTNSGNCAPAYTRTPGSVEANLNNYVTASCFASIGNLPSGTVLSGYTPQQGSGTGNYVIGNNGVATDPGVGTLFGSSGRGVLQGPFGQRFDLSASKSFHLPFLGEQGSLTFRAEAFKVMNNPIFANPQNSINSTTFGQITSTLDSTGRILQLALKLNF